MMILGLNSGTSQDGVGGVIFESQRLKPGAEIKIIWHQEFSYPARILKELLKLEEKPTLEIVSRANFLLGEFFAECALKLIQKSGLGVEKIDLIASHGQTVGHFPQLKRMGKFKIRATMQIAEPSVIAHRTGITTVSDFRSGDIAAGGEGAPVLSYPEYLLFYSPQKNRLVLNLGGIANFSLIPKRGSALLVQASDCGPCNLLLDGLVRIVSKGKLEFDSSGETALRGQPRREWVSAFLNHRFFQRSAPKSTGREEFGPIWLNSLMKRLKWKSEQDQADLLRSGVCAVAKMICRCYFENYSGFGLEEVIVSGGGARNKALLLELRQGLGKNLILSDELGVPVKAKEPIGFGILGELCVRGELGNIPLATGARQGAILGKISPGRNWQKLRNALGTSKGEKR